jgi:DNA-binding response OmpR family regulator
VSIVSTVLIISLVCAYGGSGSTEGCEGEIEMRRTVLLVEDEAKLADVLAEQLAEEDFDVRQARSLRQALRMLDDLVPDVAVIDIGLPDGSGLDVLRRLRCGADRLDSGTPVLVLTARTEEADVLRAFERGADDYLRSGMYPVPLRRRPTDVPRKDHATTLPPTRRRSTRNAEARWGGLNRLLSSVEAASNSRLLCS